MLFTHKTLPKSYQIFLKKNLYFLRLFRTRQRTVPCLTSSLIFYYLLPEFYFSLKIAVHRNRPPFIFVSFIYVEKLKRLHIFFREILNFVTTNKKSCRQLATLYKGLRANYSIVLIDGALAFFILANSTFAQFMCSTAVLASPIRVKFNADVR